MKMKPRIYSWHPPFHPPIKPAINLINETTIVTDNISRKRNKILTVSALRYQNILSYALEHDNGFVFTELGNWLIDNDIEFRSYYADFEARTPKSARLANRRKAIQKYIDNLIEMGLVYQKSTTKAMKNYVDIPLYDLTTEGKFLAWIINARDPIESNLTPFPDRRTLDKKRARAIEEVFEIVRWFTSTKKSHILEFLSIFFKKCFEEGALKDIIDFFYYYDLRYIQVIRGQELLRLFVKISHPIYWALNCPEIFQDALNRIEEETKKGILLVLKLEIENYYDRYYLVSKDRRSEIWPAYSSSLAISGRDWQLLRNKNIADYRNIVVPGICMDCKSECPFLFNIFEYIKYLPLFNEVQSNCIYCKRMGTVVGSTFVAADMANEQEPI